MSEQEINEMALLKVIPLISLGGKDRNFNDRLFYTQGAKDCNQKWEEKLRWVPVEEKLPDISKESDIYSDVVTVREHDYYSPIAALYSHEHKQWISYPNSVVLSNVTEWRRFL